MRRATPANVCRSVSESALGQPVTRRALLGQAALAAGAVTAAGLERAGPADAARWPPASAYGAEVPVAWFALALDLIRSTPGFSPPVAARALAYAGITLHEAVAPGTRGGRSLAPSLDGLPTATPLAGRSYHWPTVANHGLAAILRMLFPTAPPAAAKRIADLEREYSSVAGATIPRSVHRRSVARGAHVARNVFAWSTTDGGHEGYARNFPPYVPPVGPGAWEPTPPGYLSALQPTWGHNRSFTLPRAGSCSPGPPPAYSERPGSLFQVQAVECYRAVRSLTPEQTAIARFWSDDPGATATPPGHSISILTQIVRRMDVTLDRAAEAYAKVGIAVSDAFVSCWWTKYEYNLARPVSCIRRLIDPGWTPLLVTPPFPEYTSGHSAQSAAAACVLTDLFGDVPFTDHTHDRRGLAPRSFASFTAAAQEAAVSRLYGGIHFRSAIKRGLVEGRCVGRRVSGLL